MEKSSFDAGSYLLSMVNEDDNKIASDCTVAAPDAKQESNAQLNSCDAGMSSASIVMSESGNRDICNGISNGDRQTDCLLADIEVKCNKILSNCLSENDTTTSNCDETSVLGAAQHDQNKISSGDCDIGEKRSSSASENDVTVVSLTNGFVHEEHKTLNNCGGSRVDTIENKSIQQNAKSSGEKVLAQNKMQRWKQFYKCGPKNTVVVNKPVETIMLIDDGDDELLMTSLLKQVSRVKMVSLLKLLGRLKLIC